MGYKENNSTIYGTNLGSYIEHNVNLAHVRIKRKYDDLAHQGLSNNQESNVNVLQDLINEGCDINKLSPLALAEVDRRFAVVGLNREKVVAGLEEQIARFRDNFRPSAIKPGRM